MANAGSVRSYYQRNKEIVFFRRAMHRAKTTGSIPALASMRKYPFPIETLLVAFGEWAGSTADSTRIRTQKRKLDTLRQALCNQPISTGSRLEARAHEYTTRFRNPEHAVPTPAPPKVPTLEQAGHIWVMLNLPPT